MKNITLTKSMIDSMDPNAIVVTCAGGGGEVYVNNGKDLLRMYKEDGPTTNPSSTLADAIDWYMRDYSGNSAEILIAKDGEIFKGTLNWC